MRLGFCGWHAAIVPEVGNETVRDTVQGPGLLVFIRNEVRVSVENGAAVVAAVVEGCEGELYAIQQGCGYADGQPLRIVFREGWARKFHEARARVTVDVEVKGLGCWVSSGVQEAAHRAKHGEYGREWVDGRVGGEE